MKKAIRYTILTLELALSALFMWGGINVLSSAEEVVTTNVILHFLTNHTMIVFYGAWFFSQGLALLLSKVYDVRRLEATALMTMYLTCLYVLILSMILEGFDTGLITTVLTGVVSAAIYLKIKYDNRIPHQRKHLRG